jgi:hypothetical protein
MVSASSPPHLRSALKIVFQPKPDAFEIAALRYAMKAAALALGEGNVMTRCGCA